MYSIYVNIFVNIFCIIKIHHKWRNIRVYYNISRYLLTLIRKKKHKIPLLWIWSQFLTLNLNLSLRYAKACSSCGCFILRWHDFQISFLNRDTSGNIEEVLWSIRGPYQTIWGSPLTNVKCHSVAWSNTMTTPHRSDFIQICDLFTELDLLPNHEVSIGNWRRLWHADRGRLLLRTSGPVPFWTCICSSCCDQSFFRACRYIFGLCTSNTPRYFLDLQIEISLW